MQTSSGVYGSVEAVLLVRIGECGNFENLKMGKSLVMFECN
jgi:hypothetical protein